MLAAAPLTAQVDQALYDQGQKIFKGNCASCHKVDKKMTGPALQGARARWEGKGDIYAWIRNSTAYLKTGNAYANQIFAEYNKSVMTPMALTDAEIDAVLYFADNYAPPAPAGGTTPVAAPVGGPQTAPAWPWLLIVALLFAIVWMSLRGVKNQLRSAVSEAEGHGPVANETWWVSLKGWAWRNKAWASVISLLILSYLVVQLWNWAFVIGVYGGDQVQHYKPSQPIAFNHTLHAGKDNLNINCQYCHNSAEKSKHAGIPTANVCMNCHQAVNVGRSEAGTAEIQKIYAATGWDAENNRYTGVEKPIMWNKVHNLPDHVYFSHATHVAVGKIECQKCHGPIDEKMDVAEQWAPLTMGWCIQCHGETEVQMAGNGYYDEVHRRLKENPIGQRELRKYLEDEKITVKELGGWECAKCHY
ncbi:MAG: c-type cytochrome [Flavobacteriales bacterium]|nr:c-type cytochrome [Flavobacteriales bacterium]